MLFEFDGKQPVVGTSDTYVSETAQVIGDVRIGDRCYIGHGRYPPRRLRDHRNRG